MPTFAAYSSIEPSRAKAIGHHLRFRTITLVAGNQVKVGMSDCLSRRDAGINPDVGCITPQVDLELAIAAIGKGQHLQLFVHRQGKIVGLMSAWNDQGMPRTDRKCVGK